jgi:hypothetical protein
MGLRSPIEIAAKRSDGGVLADEREGVPRYWIETPTVG